MIGCSEEEIPEILTISMPDFQKKKNPDQTRTETENRKPKQKKEAIKEPEESSET